MRGGASPGLGVGVAWTVGNAECGKAQRCADAVIKKPFASRERWVSLQRDA